jgi:hypothetical protein
VLETLSLAEMADLSTVFVDDFGFAVGYCRQRLLSDLTPPGRHVAAAVSERWRRTRASFAPEWLAARWVAAEREFAALLDNFILYGYTHALGERLRAVVFSESLDLELGAIYVVPADAPDLLARVGNPFVWWDDAVEQPEQERQVFDFDNALHRAALARRLREASQ